MDRPALTVITGKLTDSSLKRGDVCLIVPACCISIKSVGITDDVYTQFPYGDVVSCRQRLYSLNRCIIKHRPAPGTLSLRKPSNYPNSDSPTIITFFSQYSIGAPIEQNTIAQEYAQTSRDKPFVQGLQKDTEVNRFDYFLQCIDEVKCIAKRKENERLSLYTFPAGIGRSGRVDAVWLENYLPVIKELADELVKYKIGVTVIASEAYELPEELATYSIKKKKTIV